MATKPPKETDLYQPIKTLLEGQGYEVKAEIGAADVVAVRADEPPVIVELKTGFSLSLFHQGIDRQSITDTVYIAVPRGKGRVFQGNLKNNIALCRRLGLGLITVRLKDQFVETHLDPAPYKPMKSKQRATRLLREFSRRVGDPNTGGSTRTSLITAYRQDALRCIAYLSDNGPTKASLVAAQTNVSRARTVMADNHYGWFDRVERGIYDLSPKGQQALSDYAAELKSIKDQLPR
ncbi:DUF2161 domain-containing phosphodiesterase [Cochlodiniinecator piscidefendens]|uniref:DUF2161 domain-containing phosphodiesterase n=1 Tax=Cochlodiniinecator piscidefendens TaxID=2715756 RepID=UPI00140BA10D|nr:DUF2161 family putative PD-(D/E)XK-type phosphodiesterase [Cochlodiniinecator piscidefendens]